MTALPKPSVPPNSAPPTNPPPVGPPANTNAPPTNETSPGALFLIPRSVFGATLGAYFGSTQPLNPGETQDAIDTMKTHAIINQGIGSLQAGGSFGNAIIVPGHDPYVPRVGVPFQGGVGSAFGSPLPSYGAVGGPNAPQGVPWVYEVNYGGEFPEGFWPEGYWDVTPQAPIPYDWTPSGSQVSHGNHPWRSPAAEEAWRLFNLHQLHPGRVIKRVPVGDPLPEEAPYGQPSRVMTRHPQTSVVVEPLGHNEVGFRIRNSTQSSRSLDRPRRKEIKGHRNLIGRLQALVTHSYGVLTEVQDAAEVFAWSLYGLHNGKVVPAIALERGSLLGAFQGYLAGDYRLDATGFAVDFTINQITDIAYAIPSRLEMRAAVKWGGQAGYAAQTVRKLAGKMDPRLKLENDYVSEGISVGASYVRSFDVQRQARLKSLWRS